MTKEELIELLKEYRINKSKLRLKENELKMIKIRLKGLEEVEASMSVRYGINTNIHSKNSVTDKVGQEVERREAQKNDMKEEIRGLELEIVELQNKVEEAEIRLECLYYRERVILTAYYVDNRSAEEIARNLYFQLYQRTCTPKNIYRIIESGTKKMLKL